MRPFRSRETGYRHSPGIAGYTQVNLCQSGVNHGIRVLFLQSPRLFRGEGAPRCEVVEAHLRKPTFLYLS